jgi:hypothetical protein
MNEQLSGDAANSSSIGSTGVCDLLAIQDGVFIIDFVVRVVCCVKAPKM